MSKALSVRVTDEIALKLSEIAKETERPQKAETLPTLTGKFSGLRKFRVGDFRVIFSIIGDTALVLRIGHRKEVYSTFRLKKEGVLRRE